MLTWHELGGRLGALPLAVTRWPQSVQALLRDLGVRTIGDCARLPREGFARRVGESFLLELDRAYGRNVDLRAEYSPPERWSARAELGEETVDSALFMAAIEQLIDELIFKFTHTLEMDWMLPGVPPTGRRVEVPIVVVVGIHHGKVSHERIYWDQASVLVQIGMLDPDVLPVVGAEAAAKVLDPSRPSNTLIEAAERRS